ncbi:MAG: PQQ-binding-like beta-propeller repeat protein [Pirellulales bacterium]
MRLFGALAVFFRVSNTHCVRCCALALGAGLCALAQAADWPQFRGPNASGLADAAPLATEWDKERNVAWKVAVPGVGWSSPIVLGDKLFLTTAVTENQQKPSAGGGGFGGGRGERRRPEEPEGEARGPRRGRPEGGPGGDQAEGPRRRGGGGGGFGRRGGGAPPDALYRWEVLCLDRKTGDVLWTQTAVEKKPSIPTHRTNTYASETPVTDGERLYAYFGMTGLYCYDLAGKLLWSKDLGTFPMVSDWGTGSSPVLHGDLLFVQCDNEQESFLVAFDKRTGDEKWRAKRDERSSWSTPYLWKNKLRTELVTGGQVVRSYDPSTGKVLWEMSGLNGRCSATPVGNDEMVYFGTGGGMGTGPLVALKAGASGTLELEGDDDQSKQFIAWSAPRGGPPMASPLLYQGFLYVLDQRGGLLTCYDAATGKEAYRQRVPDAQGFTSSPWAADGKIYCLDGNGQTFVVAAGPEFKLLAHNPLDAMCWASPAMADGALYLRTVDDLYCIRP